MRFVGARLRQARMARGFTARELADAVGVSPSSISSYEKGGGKIPSAATLDKLAMKLEVPVKLLHKEMPTDGKTVHDVFYRKVSTATKSLRNRLDQQAEWLCEIFDFLEEHFSFDEIDLPDVRLPDSFWDINVDMVEEVAEYTREHWGLGEEPLPDLVDLLEGHGVSVAKFQFGSDKMDGFSFWHREQYPMAVLATDKDSRSRSRFDLSHELGHLILNHKRASEPDPEVVKEQEKQANLFAAAFLMPKDAIKKDLEAVLGSRSRRGVLNSLWPLKLKWKVALQALIYRAHDLGVLDDKQYRSAFIMLSQRGWRKAEPFEEELPLESVGTFRFCLERLVEDGDYSPGEILEVLALPARDVVDICGLPASFFEDRRGERRARRLRKRGEPQ